MNRGLSVWDLLIATELHAGSFHHNMAAATWDIVIAILHLNHFGIIIHYAGTFMQEHFISLRKSYFKPNIILCLKL